MANENTSPPLSVKLKEYAWSHREWFDKRIAEASELESMLKHWRSNHDDLKQRLAFVTQRPDLPVDRIPAYEALLRRAQRAEQALADATLERTAYHEELQRLRQAQVNTPHYSPLSGWSVNGEPLLRHSHYFDMKGKLEGLQTAVTEAARVARLALERWPEESAFSLIVHALEKVKG